MGTPNFVYVSEISTTPEKLWAALTGLEFWREFSGPVHSDWSAGATIRFSLPDGTLYSEGVILESAPPHLLSHTWPDPEGGQAREKAQRLTWRIERLDPKTVKLTLVHENMTDKAYRGVSKGWPLILENLRSRLEAEHVVLESGRV
jgi:uncharacterized protein YndB with AHSA1/START domain